MKNPVIEWNGDIAWAKDQIRQTLAGKADTKPYSPDQWIECMNFRISCNKSLIEKQTGRPYVDK